MPLRVLLGGAQLVCAYAFVAYALTALAPQLTAAEPKPVASSTGFTLAADVHAAAYRLPNAPSVIVHAPPGFDASKPLQLVVYLHGYSGCVSVLMGKGPSRCKPLEPGAAITHENEMREGWDLGAQHDAAHTNTLFIVPQLAFMKRNGRPGAFGKQGGFRAFLEELLSVTLADKLGGPRKLSDIASITLVAHSAGYETALSVLQRGGVSDLVKNVVLFDALYSHETEYEQYVLEHAAGLRLVALHLGYADTYKNDRLLYNALLQKLGAERVVWSDAAGLAVAISAHPIVIGEAVPPHRLVPAHHLTAVLKALGL